jgi:hypothetical protein
MFYQVFITIFFFSVSRRKTLRAIFTTRSTWEKNVFATKIREIFNSIKNIQFEGNILGVTGSIFGSVRVALFSGISRRGRFIPKKLRKGK